jgi:hypothetical protein
VVVRLWTQPQLDETVCLWPAIIEVWDCATISQIVNKPILLDYYSTGILLYGFAGDTFTCDCAHVYSGRLILKSLRALDPWVRPLEVLTRAINFEPVFGSVFSSRRLRAAQSTSDWELSKCEHNYADFRIWIFGYFVLYLHCLLQISERCKSWVIFASMNF